MKFRDLIEGKIPANIKAINAVEKFVNTLTNPVKYQEDKYYDYGGGKVIVSNKYQGYINFFGTIVKRMKETYNMPVTIYQKHIDIIGGEKATDVTINITLQLGSAPNAIILSEFVKTPTAAEIKKALKKLIEKAKKSNKGRVKVLADILRNRTPLSTAEASKSTSMGHASMSSIHIKHSYNNVIYIKDLMKFFTESEFKAAVREDYSLKTDNISFNFKKGLMDRSGTWSETWD